LHHWVYHNQFRLARLVAVLCMISLTGTVVSATGDLILPRKSEEADTKAIPASKFPHWIHRVQYRCDACHNRWFKMKLGASNITMEAIGEGKQCGACHNGERAFGIGFGTCNRCHAVPEE
jgi:c(7)-type cytochrome triheme protein